MPSTRSHALGAGAVDASTGSNLMLEVATENRNALGLYQSCGFKETTVYDYFVVS